MSMSSLCSETRLAAYGSVSTSLALLSDHALLRALDAAEPLGSGIGTTTTSPYRQWMGRTVRAPRGRPEALGDGLIEPDESAHVSGGNLVPLIILCVSDWEQALGIIGDPAAPLRLEVVTPTVSLT